MMLDDLRRLRERIDAAIRLLEPLDRAGLLIDSTAAGETFHPAPRPEAPQEPLERAMPDPGPAVAANGASPAPRQEPRSNGALPVCALPGCENTWPTGQRGAQRKLYCSDRCRVAADTAKRIAKRRAAAEQEHAESRGGDPDSPGSDPRALRPPALPWE